ncbi:hypothetical protein IPG36_04550 [bacterium]|nr:MAG: hypothetical protein IPG36_04550 [bacterium]
MMSHRQSLLGRWWIVFWFELWRSISKPSFWVRTLAVPVMIAAILALSVFSAKVGTDADEALKASKFDFSVIDASGVLIAGSCDGQRWNNCQRCAV